MHQEIIQRFLNKKIFINFLGIYCILLLIFFGNQIFVVLKESLKIGLYSQEIIQFVILKILRDTPILVSISSVIAIFLTLIRLNKTSEKIIFHASGIGEIELVKKFSIYIWLVFIFVEFSSIFITPFAKSELYLLKQEANKRPDYIFFEQEKFQKFDNHIFYASEIKDINGNQSMKDVFIFSSNIINPFVIKSKVGQKEINHKNGNVILNLENGIIYENLRNKKPPKITFFDTYKVLIFETPKEQVIEPSWEYETMNIFKLFESFSSNIAKAEIFQRTSQGTTLLMIILISIGLIDKNHRNSKSWSTVIGLVIFICNFYIINYMAELIEIGMINLIFSLFLINLFWFIAFLSIIQIKNNFVTNYFTYAWKTFKKS